jgi:hypothetical protein
MLHREFSENSSNLFVDRAEDHKDVLEEEEQDAVANTIGQFI